MVFFALGLFQCGPERAGFVTDNNICRVDAGGAIAALKAHHPDPDALPLTSQGAGEPVYVQAIPESSTEREISGLVVWLESRDILNDTVTIQIWKGESRENPRLHVVASQDVEADSLAPGWTEVEFDLVKLEAGETYWVALLPQYASGSSALATATVRGDGLFVVQGTAWTGSGANAIPFELLECN